MTLPIRIEGSKDGNIVSVNNNGALKIINGRYDEVVKQSLDSTAVFNFYLPKAKEKFIITGMIVNAARSVTSEALVDIFEADSLAGTSTKAIIGLDIPKNTTIPLLGLHIEVSGGKWINGTTDDPTCNVTVMGFYDSV